PLIDDVLGDRWLPALGLVQAFAVIAGVDQLGFNWTAFYRAIGNTRPIAVANVCAAVVFLAVAIPLLLAEGLDGLAIGMAATTAVALGVRGFYVHRLFPEVPLVRLALRGAVPAACGAAVVLVAAAPAVPELVLYVLVVGGVTWLLQGDVVREAAGYVARRREPVAVG
ncbi:MAG TPA: hypothetical protein VGW10_14330, partial [Solirubrobacteraceae bacterium]|nr:hypothetical protein [Solirubrobacteraceae bacterium]